MPWSLLCLIFMWSPLLPSFRRTPAFTLRALTAGLLQASGGRGRLWTLLSFVLRIREVSREPDSCYCPKAQIPNPHVVLQGVGGPHVHQTLLKSLRPTARVKTQQRESLTLGIGRDWPLGRSPSCVPAREWEALCSAAGVQKTPLAHK